MDRVWTVNATRTVSYQVRTTRGCLDPGNPDLATAIGPRRRTLVIADSTVLTGFGDRLTAYLMAHAGDCTVLPIDAAESRKNADSAARILKAFDRIGVSRRSDAVVAVGGGVVTDLVGFAASVYRRGVPYVRVPTTLLGMVDAAVGVKTGLNFNGRKNRVGTYYPATVTVIDPGFLATLPDRQIANGMAEILKIALVKDGGLFDRIDRHWTTAAAFRAEAGFSGPVIDAAVTAMLEELEPNLWEDDLARLADFGHTISPALELAARPRLYHGEAVAIDIALSCVLARDRGLIDGHCLDQILSLLARVGLPTTHPSLSEDILHAGLSDSVRHRDGHQNFPLLTKIGTAIFAQDIQPAELILAERTLRSARPVGA
ncbi:sedoheptulose 7-phosphate cyclase [Nocardia sp. alder85J]|uniref:sedoheptulose 7-phosphate cyclase n=1 Tax=Nocardia sp. alder85J TaxID=2862949 RepID=UPI001CD50AAD|nr:sedoheptulose 7-phosphate cyclase [Nocardia sp. alder85J]MCX4097928.1 sedoheptulose 7-phosphate cyclase [Nocardia sp. alder85J]